MKRRQFSRIMLVTLPIASMLGVIGLEGKRGEAQRVGRAVKRRKYKNTDIEIDEGNEEEGEVEVKVGRRKNKQTRLLKHRRRKGNKSTYTTGYFPFGEEFDSADAAVEAIIDSGVMDLD